MTSNLDPSQHADSNRAPWTPPAQQPTNPGPPPVNPPPVTPPAVTPVPPKRRGIRKRWIALAAVVVLGGVGAVGLWRLEQDYQTGHTAYLAGNCAAAVGPLGSAAEGSSSSDTSVKARAELQECEALLDADALKAQGKQGDAVLAYSEIVTKYPRSPLKDIAFASGRDLIASAPDKVATVDLCDALDELEAQQFVDAEPDPLPQLLFACGGAYEAADAPADAVATYARFRADYPDHELAADVEVALARATLAETDESGAGSLPTPGEGEGTGTEGVATIVIQNDSPDRLNMVFSGPDVRVEDLEACAECTEVTSAIQECREQSPTGEYKVAPGEYDVVVKSGSGSNVIPFRGTWTLEAGEVYFSCFYISSGP